MGAEHSYSSPFEAYEEIGGQDVSAGPVTVTFGAVRLIDSSMFAFHGDSELEVLTQGAVVLGARVGIQQIAGNGRTITELYIEHQVLGGSYVLVPVSRGFLYTRNSSDGAYGSVHASASFEVESGGRVRVRANRADGSGTVIVAPDASVLSATLCVCGGFS